VLQFLVDQATMPPASADSTFNMGCGFAVYCAAGGGSEVVRLASSLGLAAGVAGAVEDGPRRVLLEPVGVVYESADLDLTPGA
jgi:phosphoribosylformylglycinamidine cyclo-ligase